MGENSKIEWTDASWNPTAGCTPVSPGCTNCYAATMARRLEAMGQEKYAGTAERRGSVDVFTGRINFADRLDAPLGWKKPRRVFVNSMSDLFHEGVPNEFVAKVFAMMYECQWHTFQVLTKRADRLSLLANSRMPAAIATLVWDNLRERSPTKAKYVTVGDIERDVLDTWPLPNVWIGVSVEDQQRADERVPLLCQAPAAVRFLSCEPLLGTVDLNGRLVSSDGFCCDPDGGVRHVDDGGRGIDWVIVGGESGPNARPCDLANIRSIVRQCQDIGTPCFVKQLGAHPYDSDAIAAVPGSLREFTDDEMAEPIPRAAALSKLQQCLEASVVTLADRKGGDPDEWPAELRVREFPR